MIAEPPTLTARLVALVREYDYHYRLCCPVKSAAYVLGIPVSAVWTLAEPLVEAGTLTRTADDALAVKR